MVTLVATDLAGFVAGAVVVAAGVLALGELDELLPQPATATAMASVGSIRIADIFFTKSSLDCGEAGRSRDRGDRAAPVYIARQ
jgi:translation initiation factor 2 gamma subunit (eIF-2gamma)